jgi:hypothetical protein
MSPYTHPAKPIKDISRYFKKDETKFTMTFIGESLELRIPRKFGQHGVLTIGDTVTTPGLMDMIIDNTYHVGMNLLASITIVPSDMGSMTYDGVEYLVLRLKHGDVFMTSYRVIQDPNIVYVLWTEFITNGGVPYWFEYDDLLKVFNHVRELTGSGIGVSRSVFEGIIAHISRDMDKLSTQYRQTDMVKPMKLIALKSVAQAPTGTVARLNGSYFRDDGLTSALRYEVDQQQPFENILRGLPPRPVGTYGQDVTDLIQV